MLSLFDFRTRFYRVVPGCTGLYRIFTGFSVLICGADTRSFSSVLARLFM